jgi:uncharacterized protein
MILDIILYIALGALSGFTAGLFGLGGGVTIVPGLLWIFVRLKFPDSIDMHLAEGSSLACMLFTSLSSAYRHYKLGNILWPVFRAMVGYVITGVIIGAIVAWWLHGFWLTVIFLIYLVFVGIKMLWGAKSSKTKDDNTDPNKIPHHRIGGGITGFSAGLLGIGGGTFTVPFLTYAKISMKNSIGTSTSLVFPVAVIGTIAYIITGYLHPENPHIDWSTGFVYWPGVIVIGISAAIFAQVGAKCTSFLPGPTLKKYFGWFVLLICVSLIWHLYKSWPY